MVQEITIDGAGRVIIPKPLRERLNLVAGARLQIFEQGGCLIITPDSPEARLVDRDGFLALDLGVEGPIDMDPGGTREERIRQLVDYALRR